MLQHSQHDMDHNLVATMDEVGIVGSQFRTEMMKELKAKVLLRGAQDTIELIGLPGSGRHQMVEAAHSAARDALGRSDLLVRFDCRLVDSAAIDFSDAVTKAAARARGGTLVMDGYTQLDEGRRAIAGRVLESSKHDVLAVAVSDAYQAAQSRKYHTSTTIKIKPLHEREEDLWELIDHFFEATCKDEGIEGSRGFSRQAKADIAQAVQETNLASVRRLRDIIRDIVFECLATKDELGVKITSKEVRPYLEAQCDQTEADRHARESALLASQFDASIEANLLDQLANLHGVPRDLLDRQVQIHREIVETINDIPRSYRNIMDAVDDIQRASIWLMTRAATQAQFRRFFGDERFMRPTKSVAWAFYNRVFKRDCG